MKNYNFFEYHDNFVINENVASQLEWGNELSDAPLVSICIPTFRRPLLLKEAIMSVLQQREFTNFEILIVDNDHEKLNTTEIVSYLTELNDPRIRYYINVRNIGVFGNWNRCIELAIGEWMTVLGDDDLLFDNYLSSLIHEIETDNSLTRVECRYQIFKDSQNIKITPKQQRRYNLSRKSIGDKCSVNYHMYLFSCYTAPHTQLYKRELARQIGGFNPDYAPISDYVFNAMYLYNFPNAIFINRYLCGYRWAVNASQNRVVRAGLCRRNRAFRKFLLTQQSSLFNRLFVACLDHVELNLLGKNKSFAQRVVTHLVYRFMLLLQMAAKVPDQIM
ncbi:MAG: glycosyltransferase [Burkholderiales bacterium]|nr:glycosyltransferase [Burkholderiales bacterium]